MTRRARPGDIAPLARVLARAFHDDPVMSWVFRRERTRPAWCRRFFALRLRDLIAHAEVWTTDERAGAALWSEPGRWRMGTLSSLHLAARLAPGVGLRAPEVVRGLTAVEELHPEPPHWYLAVLGTDPERQGEGIGSRLLAPVLRSCDEDGIPAYLESSKERNLDFYARHGFRVTGELELPRGPRVWTMWREPRDG